MIPTNHAWHMLGNRCDIPTNHPPLKTMELSTSSMEYVEMWSALTQVDKIEKGWDFAEPKYLELNLNELVILSIN